MLSTRDDTVEEKPRIIELKTWPAYYEALLDGRMAFQIRFNDRNFKVGDVLKLREYTATLEMYTYREMFCWVTYITNFPAGLRDGYVAMAIERLTDEECVRLLQKTS